MAGFFTKLDSGITESTIWQAPDTTRLVWITMLAMADQNGYVGASLPGLASRARVSLPACAEAIKTFLEPDEYSRSSEHEGRRIVEADGGWVLLNHAKYRAKLSADARRERSRVAMADLRARRKAEANNAQQSADVNQREPELTKLPQAEAEAEADRERQPPSEAPAQRQSAAPSTPPPDFDGENAELLNGHAVVCIAATWELPESWGNDAEALGWKPAEVLREAERFRQYWVVGRGQGKRRTVKGWRQSWSNWLSKAARDIR